MAGTTKLKLIVNTIPLVNVNTGIGRYLKCLYQNLEALYGDRVEFVYFDGRSASGTLPNGPQNYGQWSRQVDLFWKIPAPAAVLIRTLFQWQRELRFQAAARCCDLYHEAAFFPFLPPKGVKTVFTLHDFSLFRFPQYHPKERVLFARLFFQRRCRLVRHYIAVSEFTRGEARQFLNLNGSSVSVIPLAHNSDLFYPRRAEEIRDLRKRFSLPEDYFVFVGTGDPRKNRPIISAALATAGLSIPLVTAGWSGWSSQSRVEKAIVPLDYVADDDLARLYSGARALVYPSLYEGFGLPVLEAMSCGCPVICSRRAGLPEAAGDAALYLDDPANVEQLAELLGRVVESESLRRDLIARGLAQAARFSWEATAKSTFSSFLNAL